MPDDDDPTAGPGRFIEDRRDRDGITVVVVGEVDIATGDRFEMALLDVGRTGAVVHVHLGAVTFFSARGISALIAARRAAQAAGGALRISGASPAVRRVLQITGLVHDMDPPPASADPVPGNVTIRLGTIEPS